MKNSNNTPTLATAQKSWALAQTYLVNSIGSNLCFSLKNITTPNDLNTFLTNLGTVMAYASSTSDLNLQTLFQNSMVIFNQPGFNEIGGTGAAYQKAVNDFIGQQGYGFFLPYKIDW